MGLNAPRSLAACCIALSFACGQGDQNSAGAEPPLPPSQQAADLRAESQALLREERSEQGQQSGNPQRVALTDLGIAVPALAAGQGTCQTLQGLDLVRPGESGVRLVIGSAEAPEREIRVVRDGAGAIVSYQDVGLVDGYIVSVADGKGIVQAAGKVAEATATAVLSASALGTPASIAREVLHRCA